MTGKRPKSIKKSTRGQYCTGRGRKRRDGSPAARPARRLRRRLLLRRLRRVAALASRLLRRRGRAAPSAVVTAAAEGPGRCAAAAAVAACGRGDAHAAHLEPPAALLQQVTCGGSSGAGAARGSLALCRAAAGHALPTPPEKHPSPPTAPASFSCSMSFCSEGTCGAAADRGEAASERWAVTTRAGDGGCDAASGDGAGAQGPACRALCALLACRPMRSATSWISHTSSTAAPLACIGSGSGSASGPLLRPLPCLTRA